MRLFTQLSQGFSPVCGTVHIVNSRTPSSRPHRSGRGRTREGPTREERKEATRRAIVAAALKLLNDRGFSGLSLREVTREAGIVRRIVYWLGVAALAVVAAEVVSLVWRGASVAPGFRSISSPTTSLGAGVYVDPHTTGEFRSLAIATVIG